MKNAVGYVRISSQDQSVYSLDYQEATVRKYCKDNNVNLLELFKDNGESSYTFDRPDWKSLEKFIRKNKSIEYLIIYDHDRFSRNLAEALMKIKELQDKFGITVLATTDRLDLDITDSSNYLMRAFKYMMAENELMRIRERTAAGMRQAAMSGYYANKAPYGYLNSRTPDGKPLLIEDPDHSRIVREIFKLKIEGKSPEAIREIVKAKGFKLKGHSAVQSILSNIIYAGFIKVPAYKKAEEYIIKGKHKGIVSEDDYWTAQALPKPHATQIKDEVPLRGVLKCWCGKPVTAGNSKGRNKYYWYYLCSEHKENMPADKLHKQLNEILQQISFSKNEVEWFKEKFLYEIGAMTQDRAIEITKAESDLKNIKLKISSTEEKYLSNQDINPDTFKKVITGLKIKKVEIEKTLRLLSSTTNNYVKLLTHLLPKMASLHTAYESMDLLTKQKFLKIFFGENLNWGNGSYRTTYLHPFIDMKATLLKDNGLLRKEQPVIKIGSKELCTPYGNPIESVLQLSELFKIA